MPEGELAIVWFRRDLRVDDHPAMAHALDRYRRVVPVYVLDDRILAGRWPSPNRRWFLAGALRSLADELERRGATLVVKRGDPAEIVPDLATELAASAVVASRDYSPYGRRRDEAVRAALESRRVSFETAPGVLVHEPDSVLKADGQPFVVFSPFLRRWLVQPVRGALAAPGSVPSVPAKAWQGGRDELARFDADARPTADPAAMPEPTEAAARRRLERWAGSEELGGYASGRDRLDVEGTSRLSQDLRFGLLSPVQVLERCGSDGPGRNRFRAELGWRDFYAHLLWHQPRLARESGQTSFDAAWAGAREPGRIEAWKAGRTGYPVVDAAMRQLLVTGWMPNRARMIVASFLTRHLLVDWRVGEAHFMTHLLDGDPASNNGNWQWVASTGTDAQPYFRIFNPTAQGRRHDPDGAYVRRWVPELAARADLAGAGVHEPPEGAYIAPIVDHVAARRTALDALRSAARTGVQPEA
jgi:deoxyribodipyrimidine photo-lyase